MTRVLRVLAPNPGPFTLEGTNTWVVGRDPSIVIDPGPEDADHLAAVLEAAGPVAAIVLTHHHPDHAPGAPPLARTAGAPVLALRPREDERPLRDGGVVEAGTTALRVVATPGHSPDHAAFLVEGEGSLFTGDAVLGRGTSVVDPPDGDMGAYLRSLRHMLHLDPRTIYPGHGPVVFDATGRLQQYLEHRAMRERQVVSALEGGRSTPEEIVPEVYGSDVAPPMHPAGARSVLAHLLKLEREGRVARRGSGFVLAEPRDCERCGRPAAPRSRFCDRCGLELLQEAPGREQPPD